MSGSGLEVRCTRRGQHGAGPPQERAAELLGDSPLAGSAGRGGAHRQLPAAGRHMMQHCLAPSNVHPGCTLCGDAWPARQSTFVYWHALLLMRLK